MSRVLFLVRHYPPDQAALAYRIEHAAQVLSRDHDVTVLTAQPNRYKSARARRHETRGGVRIHRIWDGHVVRLPGKVSRGLAELTGAFWMTVVAVTLYGNTDIVVVSIPPFSYSLPGWVLGRFRRTRLLVDVRDLWLDWAEETCTISSPRLLRCLRRYESSLLKSARHITVATESFKRVLDRQVGLEGQRSTVIFNGLDRDVAPCQDGNSSSSRKTRGELRTLVYAGNLGPSQNIVSILPGLLEALTVWPNLEIVVVGDGLQFGDIRRHETERFRVVKFVDRSRLRSLYELADGYLVHLARLDVYDLTVPSKLFEYAAYRKPIVAGITGEALSVCRKYSDCYQFVPEDAASLLCAVGRFMGGSPPDNCDAPRVSLEYLWRSASDPLWRRVVSAALSKPV